MMLMADLRNGERRRRSIRKSHTLTKIYACESEKLNPAKRWKNISAKGGNEEMEMETIANRKDKRKSGIRERAEKVS